MWGCGGEEVLQNQSSVGHFLHRMQKMEPMVGIEPTTYGLRNRCSTTELHWHPEARIVRTRLALASQFPTANFRISGGTTGENTKPSTRSKARPGRGHDSAHGR